ncbi:MAG TPA: D-Ala-D-Ala carboxypeptidase family metallohydrolase [Oscillatoriaceae cyanobacterium]
MEKLHIADVRPETSFVTILPGQRLPLRVTDNEGHAVATNWKADGGEVAYGKNLAVWQAPLNPGPHELKATAKIGGETITRTLTAIVTVPAVKASAGSLDGYPIGHYPRGLHSDPSAEANRGTRDHYDTPNGFIELSRDNLDLPVSQHYTLGDFAGKDSWVNGHKFLFLRPKLVQKLETIISTINAEGYHAGKIDLLSGYRSPWLNADIGNTTTLSRHTYGDAADMIVADFNGDGRVNRTDAEILWNVVNKIDHTTKLTGGAGFYNPTSAHGYFIHTDTRGFIARW